MKRVFFPVVFAAVLGLIAGVNALSQVNQGFPQANAVQIQGKPITGSPLENQVLTYQLGAWRPSTLSLLGDVQGYVGNTRVTKIQGRSVADITPQQGYVLVWNSQSNVWIPTPLSGTLDSAVTQELANKVDMPDITNGNNKLLRRNAANNGWILDTLSGSDITRGVVAPQFLGSNTPAAGQYLSGSGIWKQVDWSEVANRTTLPHQHNASDISSGILSPARLGSGTAASNTYLRGDSTWGSVAWQDLSGVPALFPPSFHTHHASEITGTLSPSQLGQGTPTSSTFLDGSGNWRQILFGEIIGTPPSYPPAAHTHAASDITSGILATDRLGFGTASSSKFLRGDQQWASVSLDNLAETGGYFYRSGRTLVWENPPDTYTSWQSAELLLRGYSGADVPVGGGTIRFHATRGTPTSPLPMQSGDTLFALVFEGRRPDGQYAQGGHIVAWTPANWSNTSTPATLHIGLNAPGETGGASAKFVFEGTGRLGVKTTNPAYELDVNGTARATTLMGNLDWSYVTNKPSSFTPSAHTHTASDITSGRFSASLLGSGTASASTFLRGDQTWSSVDWNDISGKPSTFTPSAHTHSPSDLTSGGATAGQALVWNGTQWTPQTVSSGSESVSWGSITGTLSNQADLAAALAGKADTTHTHAAADITSGILATARLGSGTASASTFLRGDQQWASIGLNDLSDVGGNLYRIGAALFWDNPPDTYGVWVPTAFHLNNYSGADVSVGGALLETYASRGTKTSRLPLKTGDNLFSIVSTGRRPDGNWVEGARIQIYTPSDWTDTSTPADIVIALNAPGESSFFNNKFIFKGTGRLGIKTTSPAYELDVNGTARATTLMGNLDWSYITSKPAAFTPSAHTHAASDVTSGILDTARLGSGTASSSTFLRGDQTWAPVSADWSNITNKPSTFTPSAHTHPWSDITSKPSAWLDAPNLVTQTTNASPLPSGFYETSAPGSGWPSGASGWWHLLNVRHNNTANSYAMQFAGSFYDQRFWARKTANNDNTAWSEIVTTALPAQINFAYGGDPNTVLPATTINNVWRAHGYAATLQELACWTDAGTVQLTLRRSDGVNMHTAVTCSTSGVSTTSFSTASIPLGYGLGFTTASVSNAKTVSVSIKYLRSY